MLDKLGNSLADVGKFAAAFQDSLEIEKSISEDARTAMLEASELMLKKIEGAKIALQNLGEQISDVGAATDALMHGINEHFSKHDAKIAEMIGKSAPEPEAEDHAEVKEAA